MKTNWQTKKLSDVCFFQEGPGIRKYEYKKNGYPIINVRCVQDGFIDLSNAQAVDPKFIKEKWSHFQVEEGDILFTTSGTIGRTAMATKNDLPLLMNTSVVRFKSLNEKELDRYFLAWLLRSPKFIEEVKSYSSGTAQKNVGPTHLKLISISYPPLSEQKRIVKILDEAFEKIERAKENAEKNLQNSKELFESYLQNVFANPGKDWEEKKLKEIGITQTGLTPKTANKKYYGNFVPFVTPADIDISGNGSIRYDGKGLSESGLEVGRKIGKNSVLMVCIGATIGKVGFTTREVSCNQQVNTITPSNKYEAKLFYYILSTKSFFNKVIKSSSQATLPIINKGKWENLSVSFPKLISEQKVIIKKFGALSEQTKKLEEVYKEKLVDLEELKKSVLNKAFTGEL